MVQNDLFIKLGNDVDCRILYNLSEYLSYLQVLLKEKGFIHSTDEIKNAVPFLISRFYNTYLPNDLNITVGEDIYRKLVLYIPNHILYGSLRDAIPVTNIYEDYTGRMYFQYQTLIIEYKRTKDVRKEFCQY